MDNSLNKVVEYFRPPENYFWRWADGGQVIEWQDGDTICYRDELLAILKKLSREGLPSIGAILLVISACRDKPDAVDKDGNSPIVLRLMQYYGKNTSVLSGMRDKVMEATRLLHLVAELPQKLRMGTKRIWLLYTIFKEVNKKVSAELAPGFMDSFNSGQLDNQIFRETDLGYKALVFNNDMQLLLQAIKAFPTANQLELSIRTGVRELPNVAELEVPQSQTGSLLEQLEEDPKTTGLVQLTKRLIAALNIPMHARGSSDQLFGGVSDISNRGNFDRLLLSELAHDDLSLMARLANNEALYLHREELPSNPEKQRIVLVDTTLKMWGLPRVFAVSAALAFALNNKTKTPVASFALLGTGFNEIDLTTKEGIVRALEQLDAVLHCGRGLTQFMNQQTLCEEDEVFLITEEESSHSVLFQSILTSLKKPINFLITVNRNGELRFYEYIKGRKKQLNAARFDLQELLFNAATPKKENKAKKNRSLLNAPAFLQYLPSPLYLPASKIKFTSDCFYEIKEDYLICITMDQRVLYWTSKLKGALELVEHLEFGYQYCFGTDGDAFLYILVQYGAIKLYKIDLRSRTIEITKLPETLSGYAEMVFQEGHFYVRANSNLVVVDAATGKVLPGKERIDVFTLMLEQSKEALAGINLNLYKKFVNNGYSTINTVKSVYVHEDGELGIDDKLISFKKQTHTIVIRQNQYKGNWVCHAEEMESYTIDLPNKRIKFSRFVFADGSEVLADSRGFLHLKSADSNIPEITIVAIMSKPTACWASDGQVGGSRYFTGDVATEGNAVNKFYVSYIQRFIDSVKKHAINA